MAGMAHWFKLKPRVAVVRATGVIAAKGRGGESVSMRRLGKALDKAFEMKRLQAVALIVNSPGGSAAQSSLIHKRIKQLKTKHKVPVYAFVEDAAASGGYYIASAADKVYVDENSIVGSIGVIGATFGLQELIARHGIERRVYTAGTKKLQLDIFQEEQADERAHLQTKLDQMHANFKDVVKAARGSALKLDNPDLLEGDWWVGEDAVKQGLADAVGDMHSVIAAEFGDDVKFTDVSPGPDWSSMFGAQALASAGQAIAAMAASGGGPGAMTAGATSETVADATSGALAAVEAEGMWNRLGISNPMK